MLGKVDGSRRRVQQRMRWHHWLDGHEFEQALGVGDGRLVCCSSWGHKESDTTERLNLTELKMGENGNSDRIYFLGLQNHCGH